MKKRNLKTAISTTEPVISLPASIWISAQTKPVKDQQQFCNTHTACYNTDSLPFCLKRLASPKTAAGQYRWSANIL
ncbi:hypothetical protein [Niabella aquatica]